MAKKKSSTKEKIKLSKKEKLEQKNLEKEMNLTLKQNKEIVKDENYYEYVSFDPEIKSIIIDFEKYFDRSDINYVNIFNLTKRNYHSIAPLIVNDYNLVLNTEEGEDFIFFMLDIKNHIVRMKEKYYQEERYKVNKKNMTEFEKKAKIVLDKEDKNFLINKLKKIVELDSLFEYLDNFVDEHYSLNLDDMIDVNEKNLEYAITDKMNKVVLKTSIVARLLIPLVSEIGVNDKELYLLLSRVMNKFDNNTTNTKNKLYKFIELRVNRTLYSDAVIWEFLSKHAIDSTLFISDLNRKILNEIIAKLEYNKSIVSFFDVIIRYKLTFLFTYDYKVNYKTIKTTDDELDEKEKFELNLNKHDPYDVIINKYSIKMITDNIEVSEDFDYLYDVNNPFAIKLLEIFYNNEGFYVNLATKEERVKLIINMRDILLENGFEIIPDILIANVSDSGRRMTNRKKIDSDIITSRRYKSFENDYKDVFHLFINNNPLMQLASIKNYDVWIPVVYEDTPEGEEEKEVLEFSYKLLIKEIMDLLYYFAGPTK